MTNRHVPTEREKRGGGGEATSTLAQVITQY